jgi:hypothetical protein
LLFPKNLKVSLHSAACPKWKNEDAQTAGANGTRETPAKKGGEKNV